MERAVGTIVGAAVGDALGAPFEFGLPGAFSARYPDSVADREMRGGGGWHPEQATEFNGAVWPCLGSAVWALRITDGFEDALRTAVDLGGDTDTVAAVTGGLAGARYGQLSIPSRWTEPLHVPLPGSGGRILRTTDLIQLTHLLTQQSS